jgi:hypothetical protein
VAENVFTDTVIAHIDAHTTQVMTFSTMIFMAMFTIMHTTTAIDFAVNLIFVFCVVDVLTTVSASCQRATIDVALSTVLFATSDTDGGMTDTEHVSVFASLYDRKGTVVKVFIVTIMSAFGENEATSFRGTSLQSPQVREPKNDRHNPLNDVSIRGINVVAFTVIALGVKSTLHEFV